MLCEGAAADWAAVYLHNSLHTVALVVGMGFAIYCLAMLAVRLSGNWLFTKFAAHQLLTLLAVIATLGFAVGLVIAAPARHADWIRIARHRTRKRRPDDPPGGRSGEQREHQESSLRGCRLWLGRLRRRTSGDWCHRVIDDTAHRPLPDPSAYRDCCGGYVDGEGDEAF